VRKREEEIAYSLFFVPWIAQSFILFVFLCTLLHCVAFVFALLFSLCFWKLQAKKRKRNGKLWENVLTTNQEISWITVYVHSHLIA